MLQQIVETTPYTTKVKKNSYCLTSHPSLILERELVLVPITIIKKKTYIAIYKQRTRDRHSKI
jgi:hypothetical protein